MQPVQENDIKLCLLERNLVKELVRGTDVDMDTGRQTMDIELWSGVDPPAKGSLNIFEGGSVR